MFSRCNLVFFLVLVIFFGTHIEQISTLRCAKKCFFGPVQLGSKAPPFPVPCETVEIDPLTTECTAALAIRLMDNAAIGYIDTQTKKINQTATLKVILDFNIHSTVSMINYTCSSTDHCDEDFVRQSISSSGWAQINVTKTSEEIASLLIDSSFIDKNFTCAHDIQCQVPYQNCQANMRHVYVDGHWQQEEFSSNSTCIYNHLTEIGMDFDFDTTHEHNSIRTGVFCNRNHCNDQETVEKAFNIITTEYFLPLNYSQFIPSIKLF